MVKKIEWDILKNRYNHKCAICGRREKDVGILERAHLVARSKKGTQVVPMCPNCHSKFDRGESEDWELNKIGITREQYASCLPKGCSPRPSNKPKSPFEESQMIQRDIYNKFFR